MTDDQAIEVAAAWLEELQRRPPQDGERRAMLHAGPHHVRRLLRAYAALKAELNRLWSIEAEVFDYADTDKTPVPVVSSEAVTDDLT